MTMALVSVDQIPYSWVRKELTFGGPYKKGDKKQAVAVVQEWLSLHGQGLKIDKDFGPATEYAVRQFQAAQGLPKTGEVDAATFTALTQPMLKALSPLPVGSRTFNNLIVGWLGWVFQ